MVLAAGRGERLKSYTDDLPKPLLKIGNTTLMDHTLHQLQQAGIREVVINVHYFREKIMQHCGDGSRYGLKIRYSIEEELLETGGGITYALPLLGDEPFLLISGDIWIDYPLSQLMQKNPSYAHLVLVGNPDFNPKGDYGLDADGKLLLVALKKFTYASFGVLHPRLFQHKKVSPFRLTEVLNPAIQAGKVTGEKYSVEWHNITTEKELVLLNKIYKQKLMKQKQTK